MIRIRFRILQEIHFFAADRGRSPKIACMIGQCHKAKPKIQATIQTVVMAEELYATAALVDHDARRRAQAKNNVVDAELSLKPALFTDVAPALAPWRKANRLPAHRANCSRGVIKVTAEQISGASLIAAKVADTGGLKFEEIDWAGITQLDRLDGKYAVVVRAGANKRLDPETPALPSVRPSTAWFRWGFRPRSR